VSAITNTVAELLSTSGSFVHGRNNFPFLACSASLILALSVCSVTNHNFDLAAMFTTGRPPKF